MKVAYPSYGSLTELEYLIGRDQECKTHVPDELVAPDGFSGAVHLVLGQNGGTLPVWFP